MLKSLLIVVTLLLPVVSQAAMKDVYTYKGNGTVTFRHSTHQKAAAGTELRCHACHEGAGAPGKIVGFGKEWSHKHCKGCHERDKKGPQGCSDCHVKKK